MSVLKEELDRWNETLINAENASLPVREIRLNAGIVGMDRILLIFVLSLLTENDMSIKGTRVVKWREKLNQMAMIDVLCMMNENREHFCDEYRMHGSCVKELIIGSRCLCPDEFTTGIGSCEECLAKLLGEEANGNWRYEP